MMWERNEYFIDMIMPFIKVPSIPLDLDLFKAFLESELAVYVEQPL